jgi:DNA-binding GntR family transcriptional regulator
MTVDYRPMVEMPPPADTIPTITQLKTNSLAGLVQFEIERMILSGEMPPGTRLNESALANKLSVSRGPVREACRALAELGIVVMVPNRGVFVKRLNETDVEEVYNLRAGLTALAGSLLAPVVTDEQLAHLQHLVDEMDRAAASDDFATFYPLNIEIHDFIVRSTGNSRLIKAYRSLEKEFCLFRPHGGVRGETLTTSAKEHLAIVDALRQRDARACYEVSFEHVVNGKQRMLKSIESLAADRAAASAGQGVAKPFSHAERPQMALPTATEHKNDERYRD